MKSKILNLFLIGSIVSLVMFAGCTDDEEDNTPPPPTNNFEGENGTFVDSRDGKTYKWVKIGYQIWMAENLNFIGDNDFQEHITSANQWANNGRANGWCYYDNNTTNGDQYGVLYQWEAAKVVAPEGWHLPSGPEYVQLMTFLMDNGYSYDGIVGNTNIAKSLATDYAWNSCDEEGSVGNPDYTEYRNKSGFSALPAGINNWEGEFSLLGEKGFFWTSSDDLFRSKWIDYDDTKALYGSQSNLLIGGSVRCIKD